MSDVDTQITEPPVDEDGDGDSRSGRISIWFSDVDERTYDAGVQLFGDLAADPAEFANAVINCALAVASLRGSDYSWALMQKLAAYDGSRA